MVDRATTIKAHLSRRLKRYRAKKVNCPGRARSLYHSEDSAKECATLQIPCLGEVGRSKSILGPAFLDQILFRTAKYHKRSGNTSSRPVTSSMATNNVQASAAAAPQQQMPSTPQNAASPPSKRDLASWWKTFKKNARREEEKGERAILLRQCRVLL